MAKKFLVALSVFFNAVFLMLFSMGLRGGTVSFGLPDYGPEYLNSAIVVSVPFDVPGVDFGPVEIAIRAGSAAHLQFSSFRDGRQSNMAMEPLYDHGVVAVDWSGFGITIRGIGPGETVLQLFSPNGFKDVAYVTVYQ